MITLRPSQTRGHVDQGWLNSRFTFSFASYHDPKYMGFRSLRVINEDRIAPARGFGAHAHRDMEIITYILEGSLAHKDSMGSRHVIGPNTIQAMSAGTGVVHSEFNASEKDVCHLLQIWITPAQEDVEPSYQEFSFAPEERHARWKLIAGPHGGNGEPAAKIHQDAYMYAAEVKPGESLTRPIAPGRFAYLQVARGNMTLNGHKLGEGDGAELADESKVSISGEGAEGAEFIYFDLA